MIVINSMQLYTSHHLMIMILPCVNSIILCYPSCTGIQQQQLPVLMLDVFAVDVGYNHIMLMEAL